MADGCRKPGQVDKVVKKKREGMHQVEPCVSISKWSKEDNSGAGPINLQRLEFHVEPVANLPLDRREKPSHQQLVEKKNLNQSELDGGGAMRTDPDDPESTDILFQSETVNGRENGGQFQDETKERLHKEASERWLKIEEKNHKMRNLVERVKLNVNDPRLEERFKEKMILEGAEKKVVEWDHIN